ncbi:LysE family translocator [Marinomonas sp. 2405UD66-6]|uniref:LysE family translocator n=1 Tax=Marinomonas sp. 2405UD66-6 TaxID=3391834 RepID=UPI0039C99A97
MMELSFFLALAIFSFVMSATPGPNNIMLLASGAQFGFRRTLPHMFGIGIGMAMLISSALLGLGALFSLYPPLYSLLKWLGGGYLLWLAWKIANAPVNGLSTGSGEKAAPMRWWQAALFQFINPKAWMMAISGVGTFTVPGDLYVQSGLFLLVIFACVNLPTISLWAGLGVSIRGWLTDTTRQRAFNIMMGVATALTLLMIIQD